jgi:hypothetical protein
MYALVGPTSPRWDSAYIIGRKALRDALKEMPEEYQKLEIDYKRYAVSSDARVIGREVEVDYARKRLNRIQMMRSPPSHTKRRVSIFATLCVFGRRA